MDSSIIVETKQRNYVQNKNLITKTALILTCITTILLGLLSVIYRNNYNNNILDIDERILLEDDNNNDNDDYSTNSCNYIYEITPYPGELQCKFARTCNGGSGVWAPFVFCSNKFSTVTLSILISPFMILWLILLFRLLGSTAEEYFSPALEMFSVKLGLPPRFAGVSLLALGNGAADVSATVSAITSDPIAGYKLSLGALTGAAMLISGVISAVVILTAEGVPCRGALVRDVAALSVTVITVWIQLASGTIGPESVSLFLSLYVIFVVLVLTADIYHRAVVLPRLAVQRGESEIQRQLEATESIPTIPATPTTNHLGQVLAALSNYGDAANEDPNVGIEAEDLAHERPIQLHGRGGLLDHHHHSHQTGANHTIPSAPRSIEQDPNNAYTVLDDTVDNACVGTTGIPADSWKEALDDGKDELINHAISVWDDIMYDGDIHVVTKFLLLCELPFTIFRKLTVPIPCDGFYCRALIAASLSLSPLWFIYYLYDGHDLNIFGHWVYILGIEAVMCTIALIVLRYAPGGDGDMSLIFSTPIAFYGFIIAATWIDTIADSLVSLLNFLGIILHIPGPVIGLTILAWGNSMGDLSANMTMARKGLANMAMTACFAGPVFNILVGLGLGFSTLAARTGQIETNVELSPSVITGFIFIAINAISLLCVGLGYGKGRIPKIQGYVGITIYTIYLITSITLQYSKYGDS